MTFQTHTHRKNVEKTFSKSLNNLGQLTEDLISIRIDTDSFRIVGQKYGLPSPKSGILIYHITITIMVYDSTR